jgi:Lrp/AsnC family leucine-responsive transcriptional regulator
MSRARRSGAPERPLDDVDREMLVLLRDDARISLTAIGRALHLGAAAVHERMRRLERLGYIDGFHARLNYGRLELGLGAYVGLQTQQSVQLRDRLTDALRAMAEVEEFSWVTGDFDVILKVRARDTGHLQQVLFRITRAGEGHVRARTMVILSQPFCKPGPDFEAVTQSDMQGPPPTPGLRMMPAGRQRSASPRMNAGHPLGSGFVLPP